MNIGNRGLPRGDGVGKASLGIHSGEPRGIETGGEDRDLASRRFAALAGQIDRGVTQRDLVAGRERQLL